MSVKPLHILREYWGFGSFRPSQEEIINHTLEGRDTLALLPTGGGKSICFQVPALCKEGICIVVSPLIALMKDQVEALKANGISAAFLNSSLDAIEERKISHQLQDGDLKLIELSITPSTATQSFFTFRLND